MLVAFLHSCLDFVVVLVMFSFVNISQVIDGQGWVFCTSQVIGWENHL